MNLTKKDMRDGVIVALLALFGWRPICWVVLKLMGLI